MGLWGRIKSLFSSEEGSDERDLRNLADHLMFMAVGSYVNMIDEFPRLEDVPEEKYDFFLTNGAVFVALHGVEANQSAERYQQVAKATEDRLRERWGEYAARAVVDCNEFVDDALAGTAEIPEGEYGDALAAAVGMWIVWNLFGEKPGDGEMRLVRVLGGYAVAAGSEYW